MLISGSIVRDRRKVALRAVSLYSVYALWTIVHASRLAAFPHLADNVGYSTSLLAWSLVIPGIYWYIWALPLYYIFAAGLVAAFGSGKRVLALNVGLMIAAALCFFWEEVSSFITEQGAIAQKAEYNYLASATRSLFWFMLGVSYSDWIKKTVNALPERGLKVIIVAVGLLLVGMAIASVNVRFEHLIAPFAMVGAVLMLLRRLSGAKILRVFQLIGTRTLPIYIFHLLLLNVLSFLVGKMGLTGPYSDAFGIIIPLLMTVGLVCVCLVAESIIRKIGLGIVLDGVPGLKKYKRV